MEKNCKIENATDIANECNNFLSNLGSNLAKKIKNKNEECN